MEYDYATSQTPDKGAQVGPEPTPTPNAALAAIQASIPGFGGNLIEVDIVTSENKRAVYTSKAYPANANGTQRPGAIVEYSSEFSIGEGIGGYTNVLPSGYLRAEFLESDGNDYLNLPCVSEAGDAISWTFDVQYTKFTTGKQAEGKNGIPYFFCGVNGSEWYWGANSNVLYPGLESDYDWHKFELTYSSEFTGLKIDNTVFSSTYSASAVVLPESLRLWRSYGGTSYCFNRKKQVKLKINNNLLYDLVPCIDSTGVPAYYNKTDGQTLHTQYNRLIVGMTLAQARKLSNLPAGGGVLKVSLPSNYGEDEGVANAISEANIKGWNIEVVSTWDVSGASTTFALRRIWVRKTQDDQGNYVDADGTRWEVESCVAMYNADGSEPEAHGYEPYRSVEAAVAYWELEPYVYPEEEEFSQDINYN